jgi:predicted helicase
LTESLYRPFAKQWLYFNRRFNEMVYQMPRIFPDAASENIVIMVKQRWSGNGQLALMVNRVPELQIDGGAQCFPLYLYDEPEDGAQSTLFAQTKKGERPRRDAITAEGLAHFRKAYPGEKISKEDIFYYVYGLLHSSDYRERYADNLNKELPRIPCVKQAVDFWAFSKAGRALAKLHLNYETVKPYPVKVETTSKGKLTDSSYRVDKMRYGKVKVDGKAVDDKTTLIYNEHITLTGIPLEAYEYVVNGKPALDWVVERQCVKTDKDSGIVNDANDWAMETMENPKYPLELFQRVITVSLETMKIVKALPPLDI